MLVSNIVILLSVPAAFAADANLIAGAVPKEESTHLQAFF